MASTNNKKYSARDVRAWLAYVTAGEFDTLEAIANVLPDGAIVINIGAGAGTSGLLFAETLMENGRVYTVDVQDESNPRGCLQGERVVFRKAGLFHMLGKHWFQVHGDSKEVGKAWDGPSVDLLFIDGDHTYEGCAGDIFSWYNHVKVGGYIVLHDYESVHPVKREVYAATNSILVPIMEKVEVVDCMIVLRKTSGDELLRAKDHFNPFATPVSK